VSGRDQIADWGGRWSKPSAIPRTKYGETRYAIENADGQETPDYLPTNCSLGCDAQLICVSKLRRDRAYGKCEAMTLEQIADALCGRVYGRTVVAPLPGGDGFRQLKCELEPTARHGFFGRSYGEGRATPCECREYVTRRLKEAGLI
jgi:hypothetical protein